MTEGGPGGIAEEVGYIIDGPVGDRMTVAINYVSLSRTSRRSGSGAISP